MNFLKIILWPFKSYLRIMIIVAIVGLYQYQSIRIDILAREIRNLEVTRNQIKNETATLQVSIDQLTHINRIEKIASERFGLIAPGRDLPTLVIDKYEQEETTNRGVELAGMR